MSIEGPRSIRPDEFPELGTLLNRAFRPNMTGNMADEFPVLLNAQNAQNLIIIRDGERILSHVGMLFRQAVLEGVGLKMALVGSVATAEEARERGYATSLLNASLDRASRVGMHLAWISGGRGLYINRGATAVGRLWRFTVPAGREDAGSDLRELREEDLPAMSALHRREPIRLLRTMDDWRATFRTRWIMNGPGRFWGIWRDGRLAAYLAVRAPWQSGKPAMVVEYAGDRAAAAAAAPAIASRMNMPALAATVWPEDSTGRRAFEAVAASAEETFTSGTMLLLNMAGCMEALRLRMMECIGREFASGLRFSESGRGPGVPEGRTDRLRIERGAEHVEIIGRDEAARFLFGGKGYPDLPAHEGSAALLEALRPALPLPAPWYGLDYC